MKFSIRVGVLAALHALAANTVSAEELMPRYEYYPDGSYRKVGDEHSSKGSSVYGSGFLEAGGGAVSSELGDQSGDGTVWFLRGSHAYNFKDGISLQTDGRYTYVSSDGPDSSSDSATAHLFYRDPALYAAGILLGYEIRDNQGAADTDTLYGGLEAAVFADRATVYGQLAYGSAENTFADSDVYIARLGARYFALDNLRFDLEGAYRNVESGPAGFADYQISAMANFRLPTQPFTLFGGVKYKTTEFDFPGFSIPDGETTTVLAGLRWHYGSSSLKDEDRNGVLWQPVVFDVE